MKQFLIFRPRSSITTDFTEDSIELEIVDKLDIRVEDPVTIYKRLDRYFLYKTLLRPTGKDIASHFDAGANIKHVKNFPPMSIGVSDKQMLTTLACILVICLPTLTAAERDDKGLQKIVTKFAELLQPDALP